MKDQKMKAIICTAYGAPEVLKIREVEKPVPKDNEVLIKIIATAVTSADIRIRGLKVDGILRLIMPFVLGFNKPRKPILGIVLSGKVTEIGKNVKTFKRDDEVFASTGLKFGAYAQYIALPEKSNIAHKPNNASFEEAAAILFGGMSALYFLEKAGIASERAKKILIYGATGSVGSAAIEIAKHYKASVTSVCSEQGVELAKKLGSDSVIVYTQQDFTKLDTTYDIIFDAVGKIKRKDCSKLLNQGGTYITVGGMDVAKETTAQMEFLKTLYENEELNANIDSVYTMNEIVEAHRYVDTGRKKSNVVVKIA